jgi:hypothetical protein
VNTVVNGEPQPVTEGTRMVSPELGAVLAERDRLRELLDSFTRAVIEVSDRPALTALAGDVRKRAELDPS